MADIAKLEAELLAAVVAAKDDAALEAVRVSALGKKGSISELLKSLGTITPEERKLQGPLINGLRDRVSEAIARRRAGFKLADLKPGDEVLLVMAAGDKVKEIRVVTEPK
jgi:phenylalanyl-tRNA synthetase alpha chain